MLSWQRLTNALLRKTISSRLGYFRAPCRWEQTEANCQRNLLRNINTDDATLKTTCIARGLMVASVTVASGDVLGKKSA